MPRKQPNKKQSSKKPGHKKSAAKRKPTKGNRKTIKPTPKNYDAGGIVSPLEQDRRQKNRLLAAQSDPVEPGEMSEQDETPDTSQGWTEQKLKETFHAAQWLGKADEMKKKWLEVPQHLREAFDFVSVLAHTRQMTVQRKFPGKKLGF